MGTLDQMSDRLAATKNAAVFLDRDGVINQAVVRDGRPYPPQSAKDLRLIDGVEEGLQRLRVAGFKLYVVTNQPDIARGKQSQAELDKIHAKLNKLIAVDEIRVCPHDDADRCDCRKPLPGMLITLAQTYNIDLSASYMIGDRWRDISCGKAAAVTSILIDYNYAERMVDQPDHRVNCFSQAVEYILKENQLCK